MRSAIARDRRYIEFWHVVAEINGKSFSWEFNSLSAASQLKQNLESEGSVDVLELQYGFNE